MSLLLLLQNNAAGSGGPTGGSITGDISLYTSGSIAVTGNANLFVEGGVGSSSGNIPLYTNGVYLQNGNIPLVIQGYSPLTKNTTLYTSGPNPANASLNLMTQGPVVVANNNNISLFVTGSAGGYSSYTNSINLFLHSQYFTKNLNLSLRGEYSAPTHSNLNLSVVGGGHFVNAFLDMVCFNRTVTEDIPLYVKGLGTTAGAFPADGSMNLFIQRPITDAITLYLRGPAEPVNATIPMYVKGAVGVNNNIPLSIKNVIGLDNSTTTMYTHGF